MKIDLENTNLSSGIKYIAVDMDGTILNNDHLLEDRTRDGLIKLQENGYTLILATGRPINLIGNFAKELRLDEFGGYIISNNGALVYDGAIKKVLFEDYLDIDLCKEVLEILAEYDIKPYYWNLETETMYVEDAYAGVVDTGDVHGVMNIFQFEKDLGGYKICEVKNLADNLDFPLFKIMVTGNAEYMIDTIEEIRSKLPDAVHPMLTSSFALEIVKKGISKGHALQMLGIDLNRTMAFGDSMNDLEMVEMAKYGVAMDNAMDELKDIAFDITKSNKEAGVIVALEKYGLI